MMISEETQRHLLIVGNASNLSLFTNWTVTPAQILEYLNKWYPSKEFTIEEIKSCLEFYLTTGGCAVRRDGVNDNYDFLADFDEEKRYLMPDGISFFYGKDKETTQAFKVSQKI